MALRLVDTTTQPYEAPWYLELDRSSRCRTGKLPIDDRGSPFHTTSDRALMAFRVSNGARGGTVDQPSGAVSLEEPLE